MSYQKIQCGQCQSTARYDMLYAIGDEQRAKYICITECEGCGSGVISKEHRLPKDAVKEARAMFSDPNAHKTAEEIKAKKESLHEKWWKLTDVTHLETFDFSLSGQGDYGKRRRDYKD